MILFKILILMMKLTTFTKVVRGQTLGLLKSSLEDLPPPCSAPDPNFY